MTLSSQSLSRALREQTPEQALPLFAATQICVRCAALPRLQTPPSPSEFSRTVNISQLYCTSLSRFRCSGHPAVTTKVGTFARRLRKCPRCSRGLVCFDTTRVNSEDCLIKCDNFSRRHRHKSPSAVRDTQSGFLPPRRIGGSWNLPAYRQRNRKLTTTH